MATLDPEQAAAVSTEAPRVLVLAGAGSGKTRTIAYRVAHLVRDRGSRPERILLATFTQRAARSMRGRIEHLLGDEARGLRVGTFHALALRAVRTHAAALGISPRFALLGSNERSTLLTEALLEAGLDPRGRPGPTPERFGKLLGRASGEERALSETVLDLAPDLAELLEPLEQAAEAYARRKGGHPALDFDDLLVLWRMLLDPQDAVAKRQTASLDHVLVDEYQDTSPIQAGIAEDLAAEATLFVVGDDAQCIYGFRGSRFENILEFPTYAPTQVFRLSTSYRSPPSVVALARAALELNPLQFPKPLRSALESGAPVRLVSGEDEADEAFRVAHIARTLAERGVPFDEQAVLVRRHRDAAAFEVAMAACGIPHVVRAGQRFFERAHVADALAHLRVLADPYDAFAWRRVLALRPGVGPKTVAHLTHALRDAMETGRSWASALRASLSSAPSRAQGGLLSLIATLEELAEQPSAASVLERILEASDEGFRALFARASDPRRAEEDIIQLAQSLEGRSLEEAVDDAGLGELGEPSSSETGVTLSTIHGAKGLEWTAVFVAGLADGRFPVDVALREPDGEAEERRLFYVAVTRAARFLFLTRPQSTRSDHGQFPLLPSRFLEELPRELYEEDERIRI